MTADNLWADFQQHLHGCTGCTATAECPEGIRLRDLWGQQDVLEAQAAQCGDVTWDDGTTYREDADDYTDRPWNPEL